MRAPKRHSAALLISFACWCTPVSDYFVLVIICCVNPLFGGTIFTLYTRDTFAVFLSAMKGQREEAAASAGNLVKSLEVYKVAEIAENVVWKENKNVPILVSYRSQKCERESGNLRIYNCLFQRSGYKPIITLKLVRFNGTSSVAC